MQSSVILGDFHIFRVDHSRLDGGNAGPVASRRLAKKYVSVRLITACKKMSRGGGGFPLACVAAGEP